MVPPGYPRDGNSKKPDTQNIFLAFITVVYFNDFNAKSKKSIESGMRENVIPLKCGEESVIVWGGNLFFSQFPTV